MTCVSLDALTGARAAGQQSTKTAVRVMFSRAMRLLDEPCWTVDLCMPCKLNTSLKKLDPAQADFAMAPCISGVKCTAYAQCLPHSHHDS